MYKLKFIILFSFMCLLVKAQTNEGTVNYNIVAIDTIDNTITVQDSIYSKFAFKPNKTNWELGLVNQKQLLRTIMTDKDVYLIMNEFDSKTASHGSIPIGYSFNDLLNYSDTSMIITQTTTTKTIAGQVCKKLILNFNLPGATNVIIWYNDTFQCNSIIPGVGINKKSIKGLILEYEIPTARGKNIITANTLSLSNVDDMLFSPNLSDYTVSEF